jgi:mannose-6-phosphate isomerase-like protein (cupin superfamily)
MHSSFQVTAFPIDTVALHLDGAGPLGVHEATPEYWSDLTRPEFHRGQILSVFRYTETWNYRERHPDADELALVLEGSIDLLLDRGEGEEPVPVHRGTACVIPAGVWHRLRVHESCTVLFVTPVPARTEHQEAPGHLPGGNGRS